MCERTQDSLALGGTYVTIEEELQFNFMRKHILLLILSGGVVFCAPSKALVIYADDFNSNTPGLDVVPSGWTIGNSGTVDIIGSCSSTTFIDLLPGNGCYIDLDGSITAPGLLQNTVNLQAGFSYDLNFFLAGNQRISAADTVNVAFGATTSQFTLQEFDPFTPYSLAFTPSTGGSYTFSFLNGGGENVGALLDNVVVNRVDPPAVPAVPGPLPLLGAGTAWAFSRRLRLRLADRRGSAKSNQAEN